jgi:mRNA interferase YafQ
MRQLVLSSGFKRAFCKFVKRNPRLQSQIEDTLSQMQTDAFMPKLGTHKLSGNLSRLRACSCGYDCLVEQQRSNYTFKSCVR